MNKFLRHNATLKNALDNNEISIRYQPIINADTGQLYGVEVLSRWFLGPERSSAPSNFVLQFEKAGLGLEFTQYIFTTVEQELDSLGDLMPEGSNVSINFNASEVEHPSFIKDCLLFRDYLMQKKINFILELTESQPLTMRAVSTLHSLSLFDIKIFLDDFGKKYSNLNYLLELNVDGIKIDRIFIKKINTGMSKNILKMVLGFATLSGIDVISEGVESESQRDSLLALGGTLQQGYVHSWPLNISDLKCYLKSIKIVNNI